MPKVVESKVVESCHRLWTRCPFCRLLLNKYQITHLKACRGIYAKELRGSSAKSIHKQIRDDGYDFTMRQSIPEVTVRGVLAAHGGGEVAEACVYSLLDELKIKVIDHPSVFAIASQVPQRMVSHISLHAIIKYIGKCLCDILLRSVTCDGRPYLLFIYSFIYFVLQDSMEREQQIIQETSHEENQVLPGHTDPPPPPHVREQQITQETSHEEHRVLPGHTDPPPPPHEREQQITQETSHEEHRVLPGHTDPPPPPHAPRHDSPEITQERSQRNVFEALRRDIEVCSSFKFGIPIIHF